MAEVKMRMTAHGIAVEKCAGCDSQFKRGEQMTGVEFGDGDPAGWFCAPCLKRWTETGKNRSPGSD